ncbi:MAG: tetratricopeptide repeat protein [Planctomycetia bacterium]
MLADVKLLFDAAFERFCEGDHAEATRICCEGLKKHPDAGRLWELHGLSSWRKGLTTAALSALEHATALVPLTPLAQVALAALYLGLNKEDYSGPDCRDQKPTSLSYSLAGSFDLPARYTSAGVW